MPSGHTSGPLDIFDASYRPEDSSDSSSGGMTHPQTTLATLKTLLGGKARAGLGSGHI